MPVVWHHTKCKYAHIESIPGIGKDSFESLIVCRGMKYLRTRSCAIEDVIDNTARCDPSWPSHGLPSLVRIMYGCVTYAGYYTTKKYLGVLLVSTEEKKVPDTFTLRLFNDGPG
jgi:hypothetical protein